MSFNVIYTVASFAVTIAALILIGVKFKKDDEKYYPLYIFLYYFISAFSFKINQFPIPIGFLICIFYFATRKNIKNKRAKQLSIALGIIMLILTSAIPYIHYSNLSKSKTISVSSLSTKSFSFTNEYEAALKSLGSEVSEGGSPTISSFSVEVDKSAVHCLHYTLNFYGNTYQSAEIIESANNEHEFYVYPMLKTKSSNSLLSSTGIGNISSLNVDAKSFFEKLDAVNIGKLIISAQYDNMFMLGKISADNNYIEPPADYYSIEGSSVKSIKYNGQTGVVLTCDLDSSKVKSYRHKEFFF